MCGRYSQTQSADILAETFDLAVVLPLAPRYNIAPTQQVPAVVQSGQGGDRQLKFFRWGLIPSWAKDPQIGNRLINARSETVSEKPSFRTAFQRRRCLILADGFYEWQKLGRRKQPYYFRLQDGQPFAFAGLWEHWQAPDGTPVESCTILTTAANELLEPIHDRMPVLLPPDAYDQWLDPGVQAPDSLQSLLQPYAATAMTAYPVSTQVNSPTNDVPDCLHPQEI